MKYDPIDALFEGLTSAPLRITFGLVTMASALAACVLTINLSEDGWHGDLMSWADAFFIFILTIFVYWNDLGGWLALGLLCFIGQWGALYAFVISSEGKTWWFILLLLSLTCYFPVALEGQWWYIIGGFSLLTVAYWGLPGILIRTIKTRRKN